VSVQLTKVMYISSDSRYMSLLENNFVSLYLLLLSFNAIIIISLSIILLPIYRRE